MKISLYSELPGVELLARRSTAEGIVEGCESLLSHVNDRDNVVLDFTKIISCTASFLDELFILLKRRLPLGAVIIVENLETADLLVDFEALVGYYKEQKKEDFAVIYRKGEELDIIGNVDRAGKRTFELLKEYKTLTSKQLADIENKAQNAASNQLNRLYKVGLVHRDEVIDAEGRMFEYHL